MQTLPFIKMHGLGNDYVFVDCFWEETFSILSRTDLPQLARRISDRHTGVGSDGLVLILPDEKTDARMRMFNSDGSEAQMCGNAIRCVGKYLYESYQCHKQRLSIATIAGVRELELLTHDGEVVTVYVNMGVPRISTNRTVIEAIPQECTCVNMGNPHAVYFSEYMISQEQLHCLGAQISTHPHFPEGTNVEFACVRNRHEIDLRVWERGTGETMACGTGACATVAAAIRQGYTDREVTVHLSGGDLLIRWDADNLPIMMSGSASKVFCGEYYL